MDDEDSQLLGDDLNIHEIVVKCEPINDFESIGNEETLSQLHVGKGSKRENTLVMQVSSEEFGKQPDSDPRLVTCSTRKRRTHVDLDPFERDVLKILQANRSRLDYNIHDPDTMFFLSHVPMVKQLNSKVKLEFQIKLMQLLESYSVPSIQIGMRNQSLSAPSEFRNMEDSSSNDLEQ